MTSAAMVRRQVSNTAPLSDAAIMRYAPSVFAQQAHESRSSKYQFMPTSDILPAMRDNGFYPVRAMESRSRKPGQEGFVKHMLVFRQQDAGQLRQYMRVGDIQPELLVINSHNGTSSFQLTAGFFRLICSNGMVVADSTLATLRIPHVDYRIVGNVIDGSFRVIQELPKVLEQVETWRMLEVNPEYQRAYARKALEVRYSGAPAPVEAPAILNARRSADRGSRLWEVYNVVQENTMKGGLLTGKRSASGSRLKTAAINAVDNTVNINKRLWELTGRFAEGIQRGEDPNVIDLAPIRAETLEA